MSDKDTMEPKDRLGETLRRKERAEEDKWFAEQEKLKIERLRRAQHGSAEAEPEGHGTCPRCNRHLVTVKLHGIAVEECPKGCGMWLDQGELGPLAERERDGWLGRYFYRPRLEP